MDLTMVCGGLYISLLRGLDPAGADRAVEALHRLAKRESCTPGERDIFQKIADSITDVGAPTQPPFRVIKGGAA
jgi:hypothetical protein